MSKRILKREQLEKENKQLQLKIEELIKKIEERKKQKEIEENCFSVIDKAFNEMIGL